MRPARIEIQPLPHHQGATLRSIDEHEPNWRQQRPLVSEVDCRTRHDKMYTVQDYITEEWVRWGVAAAVVILRAGVRLQMVGWRNLDGTDLWCSLGLVSWAPTRPHKSFHLRLLTLCLQVFYITVTACNYILTQRKLPMVMPLGT
jgi:hypothetical protein